jgi:hypothetical protein
VTSQEIIHAGYIYFTPSLGKVAAQASGMQPFYWSVHSLGVNFISTEKEDSKCERVPMLRAPINQKS